MRTEQDFLRDKWASAVAPFWRTAVRGFDVSSFESLIETEWDSEFEHLMRNRMILGRFRYGPFKDPAKPQYDRIESIRKRLSLFVETGDTEMLVDCANLCMCEFCEGDHPHKHFGSTNEHDCHVQRRV